MTQSLKSYLPVLVTIAANQAVAEKKIACTMQQTEEIIKEFPEEFVNEVLLLPIECILWFRWIPI